MISGFIQQYRGIFALLVLASLAGVPVVGGAYLPVVGPPPLRFEMAESHAKEIQWNPPILPPPAVETVTNSHPASLKIPSDNVSKPPVASKPAEAPSPKQVILPVENLYTNSTPQPPAANNLLVITPEMLVDYFKPNRSMTNSNQIRVLAPVNFTPPTTASMPSSQAIYNSQ